MATTTKTTTTTTALLPLLLLLIPLLSFFWFYIFFASLVTVGLAELTFGRCLVKRTADELLVDRDEALSIADQE